jgi:hypothetical protein
MQLRLMTAAMMLSAGIVDPTIGLALGCSAQQVAQCAAKPNPENCSQWTCVLDVGSQPTPKPSPFGTFSCVLTPAPVGTSCQNPPDCVSHGSCGPTGACNPRLGGQEKCFDTKAAYNDGYACSCFTTSTGQPQCQAFNLAHKAWPGPISSACIPVVGPPFPAWRRRHWFSLR